MPLQSPSAVSWTESASALRTELRFRVFGWCGVKANQNLAGISVHLQRQLQSMLFTYGHLHDRCLRSLSNAESDEVIRGCQLTHRKGHRWRLKSIINGMKNNSM